MKRVNFTGRLIYFDYQKRNCSLDYRQSELNQDKSASSASNLQHHSSYYRSTLSFRSDPDQNKADESSASTAGNRSSSSASNQSDDVDVTVNSCLTKLQFNEEYFSFADFNSRLAKSYQLHARSLFDAVNYILRLLQSNLIDCRTLRLKQTKKKSPSSNFPDVNIYTTKDSNSNPAFKQMNMIGRYSSATDEFQSCQMDKRHDFSLIEKPPSSRIYYITSLFDEPFLMLRKRTNLYTQYSQGQIDLKDLHGRVFEFHELEGFCVELAEKVCSILKITCQFRIVQDGSFGSKNMTTGIWNGQIRTTTFATFIGIDCSSFSGMVGEIVSRTADLAIAPLTISQKRMEVVDFSKPFMNLGISIMVRVTGTSFSAHAMNCVHQESMRIDRYRISPPTSLDPKTRCTETGCLLVHESCVHGNLALFLSRLLCGQCCSLSHIPRGQFRLASTNYPATLIPVLWVPEKCQRSPEERGAIAASQTRFQYIGTFLGIRRCIDPITTTDAPPASLSCSTSTSDALGW